MKTKRKMRGRCFPELDAVLGFASLSAADVCNIWDIHPNSVSRWRTGIHRPPRELIALCRSILELKRASPDFDVRSFLEGGRAGKADKS